MTIADLVRREAETIDPGAACAEAALAMKIAGVGSLVVVEEGRPIGIVTDRDLVVSVMAEGADPKAVRVRDAMSSKPIFLSETRGIDRALDAMADLEVRRLPIVDDEQKLIGVVALDDLLVLLAGQLSRAVETIEKESRTGRRA